MNNLVTKTQNKTTNAIVNIFLSLIMVITMIPLFIENARAITLEDSINQFKTENKVNIKENSLDLEIENVGILKYDPMVEYELVKNVHVTIPESKVKEFDKIKEEHLQLKIEEEQKRLREIEAKTVSTDRSTSYSEISVYTDLSTMNTITTDQMNEIISYWASKSGGTPFEGQGQTFIDASKQSGLDPIYILAHAALESGWGKANMSHNYFGIGAFDSNPSNGHTYGNANLYEGIVNGAVWISNNYYNNGQTSLYTMRYNGGSHEYCTSTTWMYDINNIIQVSYSLL